MSESADQFPDIPEVNFRAVRFEVLLELIAKIEPALAEFRIQIAAEAEQNIRQKLADEMHEQATLIATVSAQILELQEALQRRGDRE